MDRRDALVAFGTALGTALLAGATAWTQGAASGREEASGSRYPDHCYTKRSLAKAQKCTERRWRAANRI